MLDAVAPDCDFIYQKRLNWSGMVTAGERGCVSTYMRRPALSYAVMSILHVGRFIHPCTNEAMIQNVARPSLSL